MVPDVVKVRDGNRGDKMKMKMKLDPSKDKHKWRDVKRKAKQLPIHNVASALISAVVENDCLVIFGETGSGKSTQLPQILADSRKFGIHSKARICITQPRRVAAITIAQRVAFERKSKVGHEVGYAVRFEDKSSYRTAIKYATEGILLREALADHLLSKYRVVILDEAHERTLNFDVLIGLLKSIQASRRQAKGEERSDLKVVVMSATLEAEKFCKYLDDCPLLEIPGRTFPIEVFYTATPEEDYLEAAVCATIQLHLDEPDGDILTFLTGQEEIENAEEMIADHVQNFPGEAKPLMVFTLYAAMPPEMQMKAFAPAPEGTRKVILATNIAETSLTIDGVKYVVDPGFVKQRSYNPASCSDSLGVVPISQSQAKQRSGRAGRQGPGKAFHLYPESEYFRLPSASVPEIRRTNLANLVLQMKAMDIKDVLLFDFLDPPPKAALVRAFELLFALGALDSSGSISKEGRDMSKLPVDPIFAKTILTSATFGCVNAVLKIVSVLSVESIMHFPKGKRQEAYQAHLKFMNDKGDLLTLLRILNAFCTLKEGDQGKWCSANFVNKRTLRKASDIYGQLKRKSQSLACLQAKDGDGDSEDSEENILKCMCTGFFSNAAQRMPDGTYRVLTSDQKVHIHPTSVLFQKKAECITFVEMVHTSKLYARLVVSVEPQWLATLLPEIFSAE